QCRSSYVTGGLDGSRWSPSWIPCTAWTLLLSRAFARFRSSLWLRPSASTAVLQRIPVRRPRCPWWFVPGMGQRSARSGRQATRRAPSQQGVVEDHWICEGCWALSGPQRRGAMRFGRHIVIAGLLALVAAVVSPAVASAQVGGDTEVTVGSND